MSKSYENTNNGSLEEVKKALKVQKDDCINYSKGVGTSASATRVGRTSYTMMKNPKKNESSDDEWVENYKNFLVSEGWSNDQV